MGLTRSVVRNTAVYTTASILEKLVSFLMLPFYAHIFQTTGYGIIGLVDASVGLLAVAFAGGFHTAIVRTFHEEPEERRRSVVSTAVMLVWAIGLILVPLPLVASPWLAGVLLGDSRYWIIIVLALITLVVDIGGKSAAAYLIIRQRSVAYSAIGLFRMLLALSLNILFVIVLQIGIVGIFISSLITSAAAAGILLWIALRGEGLRFDPAIARRLCSFQLPLVPAEITAFASRQVERYLVRFFVSLNAVGVLEMAYKFPPMLTMFVVWPFMLSWQTKSMEVGDAPGAGRQMGRMLTGFVFLLLLAGLTLAVNIRPVLMLLTPEAFWRAASIAQIEIVTTTLAGLVPFLQFGFLYRKRTTRLAVIKMAIAAGKVAVSFLMIRRFGLAGAAYSALLMEGVTLAWIYRESQALYRIEVEFRQVASLAAAAAAVFAFITYVGGLAGGPVSYVGDTLVAWRVGALVDLLAGRERIIAELMVNTMLVSLFVACAAALNPGVVRDMALWARRRQVVPTEIPETRAQYEAGVL